jgi:hypothetical protein
MTLLSQGGEELEFPLLGRRGEKHGEGTDGTNLHLMRADHTSASVAGRGWRYGGTICLVHPHFSCCWLYNPGS